MLVVLWCVRSVKEIANMCDLSVSTVNKAEKKFEIIMKPHIKLNNNNEHTNVNDLTTCKFNRY